MSQGGLCVTSGSGLKSASEADDVMIVRNSEEKVAQGNLFEPPVLRLVSSGSCATSGRPRSRRTAAALA
jgi:hypothetical protein